jgi:hypothetical protein
LAAPETAASSPQDQNEEDMDALDNVMIGMTAGKTVTVTSDMTP